MDLGLHGRRFLITGASRGIGQAIAAALVEDGADVAIVARDGQQLERARAELERHGTRVLSFSADVTDTAALAVAVDGAAEQLGGLDGVVANVGGTVGGNLLDSTPQDFAATYELNVGHAVGLAQAAVPHLRVAGGGSIVLIASVSGLRAGPRTTYGVAKAAEIHSAAQLAQELAPQQIRVNSVSPGSIMFPGGGWDHFATRTLISSNGSWRTSSRSPGWARPKRSPRQ